jgi:hypothetical protein
MATKTYYFSGVCEWFQFDQNYKKWPLDLYLDDESMEKLKNSGAQLKVRDKNGKKYVKIGRPEKKIIKGELKEMGSPFCMGVDSEPIDYKTVGNGSVVTCKVNVFDTLKGKGTDFLGMRVDEHVVFVRNEIEVDPSEKSPF